MSAPTPIKFGELMAAIAFDGIRVRAALKQFGVSRDAFYRLLRTEPQLHAHFARAKRYVKRRRFSFLVVNEMLSELARTSAPFKQIVLARGYSLTAYKRLVDLIWRTPEWRDQYLAARRVKVMRSKAQLMSVPDDELVARGKSWINREAFRIHSMTPMTQRRAAARQYRAERAESDPLYAARQRAKRRGGARVITRT